MITHYRGFDIHVQASEAWTAEISRPNTGKRWTKSPSATLEEGQDVCVRRAKNLVDAFIALKGR